jgi:predicted nicotinamide N-methyase
MQSDTCSRLRARMARKYPLASTAMEFGGLTIDFVHIADPNRVLNEMAGREDRREKKDGRRLEDEELHLPYWAELWDSSLALCDQVSEERESLRGKNVLDLGCGMGLVGTVAAAVGARVMLADLESDALLLARLNAMQFDGQVRAVRLNWRLDRLDQRFDWIIGADIIYERPQWQFLEPFWRNHLVQGGMVLIGEPNRPTGDAFLGWIAERGWHVEVSQRLIKKRQKRIRIMRLTLPKLRVWGTGRDAPTLPERPILGFWRAF